MCCIESMTTDYSIPEFVAAFCSLVSVAGPSSGIVGMSLKEMMGARDGGRAEQLPATESRPRI